MKSDSVYTGEVMLKRFLDIFRPYKLCKFSKYGCYVKTKNRVNGEAVCHCCLDPRITYDPNIINGKDVDK